MDEHTATEIAYKNGYKAGYDQGSKDLAEKLKKYYNSLSGGTCPALVAFHASEILKQLTSEDDK